MGKLVIERDNEPSEPPAVLGGHWSFRDITGQEVVPVLWTWITFALINPESFSPTFIHFLSICCQILIYPVHCTIRGSAGTKKKKKNQRVNSGGHSRRTDFPELGTMVRLVRHLPQRQNVRIAKKRSQNSR